jgi:hypothetical protein
MTMMSKYRRLCLFVFFVAAFCLSCGTASLGIKQTNKLADVEPFSIGLVKASFDKLFSSDVAQADVDVIFYPRKNEVALGFKYNGLQYWQFWNEEGRRQFIDALNRYKEDFANQKLITNYNRSRTIYGTAEGRCEWKTLSISGTYSSSPVIGLGYRFRENSPFFSTYQNEAKEETDINPSGISKSNSFAMYFNRAQGEDLARLFDQAYLLELLGDKVSQSNAEVSRDVYIEK